MSSPRSSTAPATTEHDHTPPEPGRVLLRSREIDVLRVLSERAGRVVSRASLADLAGLDGLSARRVDALIVELRRVLPAGAILTVRRRGWMLHSAHREAAVGLIEGPQRAPHRPAASPIAADPAS